MKFEDIGAGVIRRTPDVADVFDCARKIFAKTGN